jgi:hypothetical protein
MSRRVAVIGVHGVGETVRGAMPQSLVTLLGRTGQFGIFTKQDLTIHLSGDGLGVTKDKPPPPGTGPFAGFYGIFQAELVPADCPPDVDFTKTLLADGDVKLAAPDKPPTYRTEMWSGRRPAAPGRPGATVDIFEMYWSDLSHPATNSGLGIFTQFVQLLVHLASIGRISAETMLARLYQPPVAGMRRLVLWQRFVWLNRAFYWLLSIPLVVGNLGLILLAVLFIALASLPAADLPLWRGAIYGGSAFLLGMAGAMWRMAPPPPVLRAASVLAVIGLSIGFGVWAATRELPLWPFIVLALVLAGEFLMRPYQSMRPGALGLWRGLAVVLGAAILWGAAWGKGAGPGDDRWWLAGVLTAAHGLFDTLLCCWLGYCALLLALLALGGVLWWCGPGEARDSRGRAVSTCWLTALLPAPLLIGFVLGGLALLRGEFAGVLRDPQTWLAAHPGAVCGGAGAACPSVYDALGQWLTASGSVAFLTYSLLIFTALVLAAVALAPCVLSELLPLAGRLRGFSGDNGLRDWLDGAFHLMALLGFLVVLLLLPIMADGATVAWRGVIAPLFGAPAGAAPTVLLPLTWLNSLVNFFSPVITMFGPAAVAATTGLLAASKALSSRAEAVWKSFSNVFNRLRVTIDTIQDVDNWLRERPTENTVRFQVFARYASLLRHIETAGGGDYDDIVIVAYSQGTIVTTDYLRYVQYLHTKGPLRNVTEARLVGAADGAGRLEQTTGAPGPDGRAAVPHLPVSLVTLGCPLRQLYRARFPVLYAWFDPARPDETALALGVKRWCNLYGSGDYVGRDLWTAPGARVAEACIGPQAHTRYFDSAPPEVAAVVAATLNALL